MESKYNKVLVTGAAGKLGKAIVRYWRGRNTPLTPSRESFDLTEYQLIKKYIFHHAPDAIIHCAALARMVQCEKDPIAAIETNIMGTSNVVKAVLEYEKEFGRRIRFVHVSTDGVYESSDGGYTEKSPTLPYNVYGWTKLGAEAAVNILKDLVIVRTRFFDPNEIRFDKSPVDVYTSKITLEEVAEAIQLLLNSAFNGTINVGRPERISEFDLNRKYKIDLKKCTREEVLREDGIQLVRDASMNTELWARLASSSNPVI